MNQERLTQVLVAPIVSEKATFVADRNNQVTFRVLQDATPDAATLARCGEAASAEVELVGDVHGSAPYKQALLRVYVARAVRSALAE